MTSTTIEASPSRGTTSASSSTTLLQELHHQSSVEYLVAKYSGRLWSGEVDSSGVLTEDERQVAFIIEVLCLPEDVSEYEWDLALQAEAGALGIALTAEQRKQQEFPAPAPKRSQRGRQNSLPEAGNDVSLLRGRLDGRATLGLSPPKTSSPAITIATPESQARPLPRRRDWFLKKLSVLKLTRGPPPPPPGSCPKCNRDWAGQCNPEHHLDCGHILCSFAVKKKVIAFIKTMQPQDPPSCCGLAIPEYVVLAATKQAIYDLFLVKAQQNDILGFSEPTIELSLPPTTPAPISNTPRLVSNLRRVRSQLSPRVLAASMPTSPLLKYAPPPRATSDHPDIQALKLCQETQRQRCIQWASGLRQALVAKQERTRKDLDKLNNSHIEEAVTSYECAKQALCDEQRAEESAMEAAHMAALEENDDEFQQQERVVRAGRSGRRDSQGRAVDLVEAQRELERIDAEEQMMYTTHEQAVNRLHEKYDEKLKSLEDAHHEAVISVEHLNGRLVSYLDHHLDREAIKLRDFLAEKNKFLQERWGLEEAVLRKKISLEASSKLLLPEHDHDGMFGGSRGLMITRGTQ